MDRGTRFNQKREVAKLRRRSSTCNSLVRQFKIKKTWLNHVFGVQKCLSDCRLKFSITDSNLTIDSGVFLESESVIQDSGFEP